jgi:RNA polymerase sigma-70 factor (ECF subfamily)
LGNQGSGSPRSRDEIEAAIGAFTPADWARLKLVANRYAVAGIDPMDLAQEAIVRALTDGRHCPAEIDVVRFLAEAIRSVAHGEMEKVVRRELVPLAAPGEPVRGALDPPDPKGTAEQMLVWRQTEAEMLQALLALFEDDAVARDIIDGEVAGMSADEIKAITGLTGQDYDSKRRLIRRRINKKYPKGWDK